MSVAGRAAESFFFFLIARDGSTCNIRVRAPRVSQQVEGKAEEYTELPISEVVDRVHTCSEGYERVVTLSF